MRVFPDLADGDRLSLVVHAYDDYGSLHLGTFSIAEIGSGVAVQWPEAVADRATFLIYPGALQWQEGTSGSSSWRSQSRRESASVREERHFRLTATSA